MGIALGQISQGTQSLSSEPDSPEFSRDLKAPRLQEVSSLVVEPHIQFRQPEQCSPGVSYGQ